MSGIKWGRVDRMEVGDVVIIASGPSVNDIDMNKVKQAKNRLVIAVNGAGQHIPFGDIWFTLDPWGLDGPQLPGNQFKGRLYAAVPDDYGTPNARCTQHRTQPKTKITYLHRLQSHNFTNISSDSAYKLGLSEDNSCINTGNSGYGALNLAYHIRPKRVFLLGIDGTIGYFYTKKQANRPLTNIRTLFNSAKPQLDSAGIEVFNVSPKSTINTFPKITPEVFYELLRK